MHSVDIELTLRLGAFGIVIPPFFFLSLRLGNAGSIPGLLLRSVRVWNTVYCLFQRVIYSLDNIFFLSFILDLISYDRKTAGRTMSEETNVSKAVSKSANPARKIFRGTRKAGIPVEILNDPKLIEALTALPQKYDFEVPKTIWRLRKSKAKCVALQFTERFLEYSTTISDILEEFTGVETIIMEDVTYGVCCMVNFSAASVGADFMVYYGRSCLLPRSAIDNAHTLYVFVDIKMDTLHAIQTIEKTFDKTVKLALLSTVHFVSSLQQIASDLKALEYNIEIPQCKPLSPGEIIGCTCPRVKDSEIIIFIGDTTFHAEAVLMANPLKKVFRYNPYDKKITEEQYEYEKMMKCRRNEVERAATCNFFGIIAGTLGRQGSAKVLEVIQNLLKRKNKQYVNILMSEIYPNKLDRFPKVEAFVQIACPRLSIDQGDNFLKPMLTPYELYTALEATEWRKQYPMDFYASNGLGPWTPNYEFSIEDVDKICGNCADCSRLESKRKE